MEQKQNLFPILSAVKYNKLELKHIDKCSTKNEPSFSGQTLSQEVDQNDDIDNDDLSTFNINNNDEAINGLFEKNRQLFNVWEMMKKQLSATKFKNEQLTKLLDEEKARIAKYQKKLQYIQDNQKVFEKLKQAYMSLKYNESSSRPIVEVREKSCQTNESSEENRKRRVSKTASIISDNINFDDDDIDIIIEPGYMPIKKNDFNNLKKTVDTLKSLIASEQPLSTFVLSNNREAKYRKDIGDLYFENKCLKQKLDAKIEELEVAMQQQAVVKKSRKEVNILKKIIAKLDTYIRACKMDTNQAPRRGSETNLNEKEKVLVKHIATKYQLKIQHKMNANFPTIVPNEKNATPYHTPRSYEACDSFRSCEDNFSITSIDTV